MKVGVSAVAKIGVVLIVVVYAVREGSPDTVVFLSTANFTNTPEGGVIGPDARPFGKVGFAVLNKAGRGEILKQSQAGQTNLIGGYAPLCR